MSDAVDRTLAWREQKRQAGYRPLTVWLKADVKHRIEDLAAQSRQDLGEIITAAVFALSGPTAPPTTLDALAIRRLVAEQLASLAPTLLERQAAPPNDPPGPSAPLPEDSALLRGEYGWQIQAIRIAARELRRFTCATMAKQIGVKPKTIIKTLYALAKQGELKKTGAVYVSVEGSQIPPKGKTGPKPRKKP